MDDSEAFTALPALIEQHAQEQPEAPALIEADHRWCWRELAAAMHAVALGLQQRGLGPGDAVAICAGTSLHYVAVFLGALRAGLAVVPLAPGSTPAQLAAMAADADARCIFIDDSVAAAQVPWPAAAVVIDVQEAGTLIGAHDAGAASPLNGRGAASPLHGRVAASPLRPVVIDPASPFNIIYSSGTTGTPKGIVQPHAMRWAHIRRAGLSGYCRDTVTLIATPLYSNTTLVCLIPTLAYGGCAVLMPRFDALRYLQLAEQHRATHTMLVPVQYRRLMAHPDFDRFDLTHFEAKFCTSAPFHADLKADVLARWPGALTEYYGLTEGGGTCILQAHLHPHKLHTVGQPAEGHDIRLIDDDGLELDWRSSLNGETSGGPSSELTIEVSGEIVGRSAGMMTGYHRRPDLTAAAEWLDAEGRRYIRTGDIGRFDADGFLTLLDRRKDMIISGGFNIYPSDLEAVLRQHPDVADAAVIGVPSQAWGETPVAYVVRRGGVSDDAAAARATAAAALKQWVDTRVGKTQRLHALLFIDELPRNAIGKVLKRALRDGWVAGSAERER